MQLKYEYEKPGKPSWFDKDSFVIKYRSFLELLDSPDFTAFVDRVGEQLGLARPGDRDPVPDEILRERVSKATGIPIPQLDEFGFTREQDNALLAVEDSYDILPSF